MFNSFDQSCCVDSKSLANNPVLVLTQISLTIQMECFPFPINQNIYRIIHKKSILCLVYIFWHFQELYNFSCSKERGGGMDLLAPPSIKIL